MTRVKIAIAGFQHETNTFNPNLTPVSEFERADGWPAATRGQDILEVFPGLNIAIGGFIQEGQDFDLRPILWCAAEPAGHVCRDAFDTYCGEICAGLKQHAPLDGVLLDLHGAMVAEDHFDGELEILRRVRAVVGDIPVVVALDFHANISPAFVELCDAIAIYREYPHLDMAQTGVRAARLMRQRLTLGRPFSRAFLQVPFLIPLSDQATGQEPFAHIFSGFDDLPVPGLISADAASGFPAADIPNCGPSVLAYCTKEPAAQQAADILLGRFLEAEQQLTKSLLSERQAIQKGAELLQTSARPVVLADVQDNPGAGGTSDTTGLLQALIELDLAPAVMGIFADPACIQKAWSAGVGDHFDHVIGQNTQIPGLTRKTATFEVVRLSDVPILCTGEMYKGIAVDIGRSALLKIVGPSNAIFVVVSEQRFQCLDCALLEHFGLDLSDARLIVVKSTAHFRADFDPIAQATLLVASPGLHPCRLDQVSYENLREQVSLIKASPGRDVFAQT
ncbi:M81 family metallopeptidase [Rhodobacteraceae bacterium M382]|nr:M81 family metallopeptidase [Rhodobacteraceae bacterium M382]